MSTPGYGNTKLVLGWIVSVIVVFVGTLAVAQATWMYKVGPDERGGARIVSATQPSTTQPATQPATKEPATGEDSVDHSAFDEILRNSVRNERVDYLAIRDDWMPRLVSYLDHLATVDVESLSRDEQLAYYTNLYNATMIKAVIVRFRPDYSPSDNDFAVFSAEIVRLKDRTVSLDHLEKQIMLPTFNEPRIHVVLVCAAVSCPPLLPIAYTGDSIERLMEQNMHRFISDSPRSRIDVENESMQLSQIFNWYADDFGGLEHVDDYVNRYYEGADVRGFDISFLEYSWELNIVKN